MSNEENCDAPWEYEDGWFSEPNVEFVIEPDDEKKGIFERIKSFFTLMF